MPASGSPGTELTPELIDQVQKLSTGSKEHLIDLLLFDRADDPPPGESTDWSAVIAQRAAEVASGDFPHLTREQAESEVHDAIRKLGMEL